MGQLARKSNRKKKNKIDVQPLVTHTHPKSYISEQYRTIRTNIDFAAIDKPIKTLMVTSAGPSEGKTTTIINLAIVFAQQGKKVVVIDTDLRKPKFHYAFRLNNTLGVTNILAQQVTLDFAVQNSGIPHLSVLTSGPIPPNPAELLDSNAMDLLIEYAIEQYDIVLFDTPPVLPVTDAQILANKCDGVLLIVNSRKTDRAAAVKAKELLENAKGKLLGVVINNMKLEKGYDYKYYES